MTTTVVHCKKQHYDIYIGRPSKWGNPFVLNNEKDRNLVLEMYKSYLRRHPEIVNMAKVELKDKILGCFCAPKKCHGDILARIANTGSLD